MEVPPCIKLYLLPLVCHTAKRYTVLKENKSTTPRNVLPTKGGSEQAKSGMEVKSDAEIWARLEELEKEEKEWEKAEGRLAGGQDDSSEEEEVLIEKKEAGFQVSFGDKSEVLPASIQKQICNLEVENQYATLDSVSTVAANTNRTSHGGDSSGEEDEDRGDGRPLTIKVTHTTPDTVQPPVLAEEPVSQEVRDYSFTRLKNTKNVTRCRDSRSAKSRGTR